MDVLAVAQAFVLHAGIISKDDLSKAQKHSRCKGVLSKDEASLWRFICSPFPQLFVLLKVLGALRLLGGSCGLAPNSS